jgi:Holliday junction resolvasome RuvABC endonuclease subunit
MRTLAIDAATRTAGYAVLDSQDGSLKLHAAGRIQLQTEELPDRLAELHRRVNDLVVLHKPERTAVESCMMNKFAPNFQSLGFVNMAIGAVLVSFSLAGYSPKMMTATMVRGRLDVKKKEDLRQLVNIRFKEDLLRLGYSRLLLKAHYDVSDAIGLGWVVGGQQTECTK